MSELPPGVAIETVYAIEATYAPDAAERRAPVRAAHLENIARLRHAGIVMVAGAYADMSGSLLLVRVADEAAAGDLVERDIYWATGVWTAYRVRGLGLAVDADE